LGEILTTEPYICYDSRSWGGWLAERYLTDNGLQPVTLCELDALEAIHILVAKGMGVSLVPNWAGQQSEQNQLTATLIEGDRYLRRLVLLTPSQPQRPKVIEKLRTALLP
jgi:DNA-binding transcriptional LysR family regulator